MKTKTLPLLFACVALSACVTLPQNQSGGGSNRPEFEIRDAKAFAKRTEVVVGNFKIGFLTYSKTRATAGGGFLSSGGNASVSARANLTGVPAPVFQHITDTAYQRFVAALKAQGYAVRDHATIAASPTYQKVTPLQPPVGDEKLAYAMSGKVDYYVPTGMALHLPHRSTDYGWGHPHSAYGKYAADEKIAVLDVIYVVDFLNEETYGGQTKSVAAVNVDQGLSIKPGSNISIYAGMGGTFAHDKGSVALGNGIYANDVFAEMVDTTPQGETAGNKAGTLLAGLLGGGGRASKQYDVKADPAKFETGVSGLLTQATEKLVAQITSLR